MSCVESPGDQGDEDRLAYRCREYCVFEAQCRGALTLAETAERARLEGIHHTHALRFHKDGARRAMWATVQARTATLIADEDNGRCHVESEEVTSHYELLHHWRATHGTMLLLLTEGKQRAWIRTQQDVTWSAMLSLWKAARGQDSLWRWCAALGQANSVREQERQALSMLAEENERYYRCLTEWQETNGRVDVLKDITEEWRDLGPRLAALPPPPETSPLSPVGPVEATRVSTVDVAINTDTIQSAPPGLDGVNFDGLWADTPPTISGSNFGGETAERELQMEFLLDSPPTNGSSWERVGRVGSPSSPTKTPTSKTVTMSRGSSPVTFEAGFADPQPPTTPSIEHAALDHVAEWSKKLKEAQRERDELFEAFENERERRKRTKEKARTFKEELEVLKKKEADREHEQETLMAQQREVAQMIRDSLQAMSHRRRQRPPGVPGGTSDETDEATDYSDATDTDADDSPFFGGGPQCALEDTLYYSCEDSPVGRGRPSPVKTSSTTNGGQHPHHHHHHHHINSHHPHPHHGGNKSHTQQQAPTFRPRGVSNHRAATHLPPSPSHRGAAAFQLRDPRYRRMSGASA